MGNLRDKCAVRVALTNRVCSIGDFDDIAYLTRYKNSTNTEWRVYVAKIDRTDVKETQREYLTSKGYFTDSNVCDFSNVKQNDILKYSWFNRRKNRGDSTYFLVAHIDKDSITLVQTTTMLKAVKLPKFKRAKRDILSALASYIDSEIMEDAKSGVECNYEWIIDDSMYDIAKDIVRNSVIE